MNIDEIDEVVVPKETNRMKLPILYGCIAAMLVLPLLLFFCASPLFENAVRVGAQMGETAGRLTGMAKGSLDGVTVGLKEGAIAGREEGLSAKDTVIEMQNTFERVARLEVLVANVSIPAYHEVGKQQYAAMYLFRGHAVFTIDMSEASVSMGNDKELVILLPEPVVDVNIDESETELVAEYQKKFFNGSTDDGFKAYLNSLTLIDSIATDKVANFDTLLALARESAKNQISILTANICGDTCRTTIGFRME